MAEMTNPVEALFLRALDVPAAERHEFLLQECGEDEVLLEQVRELLAAHEQTGSFVVDRQAVQQTDSEAHGIAAGSEIGPYKLLQEIGEGGMGVVFMAEQKVPIKRRVALKVIKPGMDSKQVLARFEAERQALAMMDHPNIARVYEAGKTDGGLPYFVMELVKGVPITRFCDDNHMTTRERLKIFVDVCMAVQHAHQKGIIHRDLKPSNVLVAKFDDKPVVKIIDFGVAKATNQELTERTMFTQFGQIVGTLEYMSPEQAQFNQLDIDTRSDIYSLGVLLYELLTGAPPFDRQRLRTAAFDEIMRIIREEEPPRPSARLSTLGKDADSVSKSRSSDISTLGRLVRGDVDLIVMKAMEKDRVRRYESASGLAADLKRYLDGEPIEARPKDWSYRLSRFAKRNKAPIAATCLLSLLVAFCIGLITKWIDADLAKKSAIRSDAEHSSLLVREITNAGFGQNFDGAETAFENFESEQLNKARGLAVSEKTLQTLKAQIKLLAGEYEAAIDILDDIRVGEYPNNLTVDSMLCLAYQRNGNEELHFDLLPVIRSQECKEFSDYLFRGYALTTFFTEEAKRDLSAARSMDPSNHMAMILSSIAGVQSGARNLDAENGIESLQRGLTNLNAVRAYFPANERVLASLLTGNLFLSLRLREVGRTDEANAARDRAAVFASQLNSMSPDALENRSSFHLVTGDHPSLQADYERSLLNNKVVNNQALCAAISAFRIDGESNRALEILLSTDREFQASTKAFQIYAQFDHFRSKEDLVAAMNALDMNVYDETNIYGVFDWTLHRILNDEPEMRRAISGPLRYSKQIGKTAWVNQLEFALGREIDPCTGSQNRFDKAAALGYLAFDALAEGDRASAKRYFDAILETGYFESFMYSWATAFSEKLEDDEWLPWLRK